MAENERARVRAIMYEPSAVWLTTELSGDRWLFDQYVLLDVTDTDMRYCYDPSYEVEWPDGPYKLMASGQWRAEPRDSVPEPDIEAAFQRMAKITEWKPAAPTEWSVAEHPGKAMLWTSDGEPCLLGEDTWTAIHRHYPDVRVDYGHGKLNVFRFSLPLHSDPEDDECFCANADGECGCDAIPFCFAAGIRCPEGEEDIASAIAKRVGRRLRKAEEAKAA